jgi:hypothetical protein
VSSIADGGDDAVLAPAVLHDDRLVSDALRSRKRFSTQVDPSVQDRARATVRGVRQATGRTYSLAQLTEDALQRHCADLEDAYHDGKPWPHVSDQRLPPGRQ